MAEKKQKSKAGLFDLFLYMAVLALILFFGVREFSFVTEESDSVAAHPGLYKRHFVLTQTFPYFGSYFLMEPDGYNPKMAYPLTVVLQGRAPHPYAADYLAYDAFRKRYQGFVLVPVLYKRAVWDSPQDKRYAAPQKTKVPDALPQVVDMIAQTRKDYSVDGRRIYITGYSMGALGVYGALQHYPNLFAGATALSGIWDPKDIDNIDTPLWIFQGSADTQVTTHFSGVLADAVKKMSAKEVRYDELLNVGHETWGGVYVSPKVWDWLFQQQRPVAGTAVRVASPSQPIVPSTQAPVPPAAAPAPAQR